MVKNAKSLKVVKKNLIQKTQYAVIECRINSDLTIKHIFHNSNNVFDNEDLAHLYCDNAQKRDNTGFVYKVIAITIDKEKEE